ncbi:hypothetical protein HDU81_002527 [Chytriomyces hyalinus]|nr:hypothetical protein HDU81_002527 [Chytriomyces hyalinus]
MTSVAPSDLVPGRTRSASAETSKSANTLHQSLISNIVRGILTEIQCLVKTLDVATSNQELVHKQLEMVALLFDSLAPMLPNFDREIAPLIAEFCIVTASASTRLKENDVLHMRNEPNLPNTKSLSRKESTKRAALPTNEVSSSPVAAALFGDPSIPLANGIVLSSKEHVRTFSCEDDTKIKFNLVLSNLRMKIISQITQKTMVEIDLTKWETES